MTTQDVLIRARLASEAEAVARGFPPGVGRHIFSGIVEAGYEEWDSDTFDTWFYETKVLYRHQSNFELLGLYMACKQIMNEYIPLLRRARKGQKGK